MFFFVLLNLILFQNVIGGAFHQNVRLNVHITYHINDVYIDFVNKISVFLNPISI